MGRCDNLVKKLIKTIEESPTRNNNIEHVAVALLEMDKLSSAISLAKEINPSSAFASTFARGILELNDGYEKDFIFMKGIAKEPITEEEADSILRRYGPTGKNCSFYRSVPKEILQASSKIVLVTFFEWVLESKTVGGIECARDYFPYLKAKI